MTGDRRPWRFWPKVSKSDGCWEWMGRLNAEGYGVYGSGMAHRACYEICVGSIPAGHQLDHVCHTLDRSCAGGPSCAHRRCVNPQHLEPVPPAVNSTRARRDTCRNGHPYGSSTYIGPSGTRKCHVCLAAAKRRHRNKTTRRLGHRLVHAGPGRWQCRCGVPLGTSQATAARAINVHTAEMWAADTSTTRLPRGLGTVADHPT
jgi:hypothetical protein